MYSVFGSWISFPLQGAHTAPRYRPGSVRGVRAPTPPYICSDASTVALRMQPIIPPPEIPKDPDLEEFQIHRDSDYYEWDSARSARGFMKTR